MTVTPSAGSLGMSDACAAHATRSRRRIGGRVPVAPTGGARVGGVDAPARDAGAASLPCADLLGSAGSHSGGQNQSNPHLAGVTFAVDVRPRGSDGHTRDPWLWGSARLLTCLLDSHNQPKVDPAHAPSCGAPLLLHGAATEPFDIFCSAAKAGSRSSLCCVTASSIAVHQAL